MAAHNDAHAAGYAEILPAHLVLGLLPEPDRSPPRRSSPTGTTLDTVRQAAPAALPEPATQAASSCPYGADAKKILELTFRKALRLGHNCVGTEHMLLAILEVENGGGLLTGSG